MLPLLGLAVTVGFGTKDEIRDQPIIAWFVMYGLMQIIIFLRAIAIEINRRCCRDRVFFGQQIEPEPNKPETLTEVKKT